MTYMTYNLNTSPSSHRSFLTTHPSQLTSTLALIRHPHPRPHPKQRRRPSPQPKPSPSPSSFTPILTLA